MTIKVDLTLDCKGLACPMPIVRTKKVIDTLQAGQVVEVEATDKGSLADIQSWAKNVGHQYLGSKEEGDVFKHYVRKANEGEVKEAISYPHTMTNEELKTALASGENYTLLDVREPAEFIFGHIPSAVSIPLGELEERYDELDQMKSIYVICHTGSRSDLACQSLQKHGFSHVKNVLPGMSEWKGAIEKN
ncbi:sulfurtransferase TusA family protein [Bacillus manliponensis]|uniref:sulfurtransferase TusA family protein n=1 Tax=Bacillus manliponensis TaxID=574376 RepID=UPI003510EE30